MSRPARPRLVDVAARAGVSLKTASRVMNQEPGVSAETSERVLEAAQELGFRLNRLAASLAGGGASAVVGLLVPDVADPFVAGVAAAVERTLALRGLQVIAACHGDDPHRQQQLADALVERRVDALLVVSAPGPMGYLRGDLAHGLVVVAMDRPIEGLDTDTVTVDNEAGAREAVLRLARAGHRRIAAVAMDLRLWTVARRMAAYRAALLDAGLPADEAPIATDRDPEAARAVVRRMLAGDDPPTAVLATSHIAGRVAMRAARDAGATLDLAVFDSMDDNDLIAAPPSVVVSSGADRIGRLGAALALERLDGLQVAPRHVVLPALIQGRGERHAPSGERPAPLLPARPASPSVALTASLILARPPRNPMVS